MMSPERPGFRRVSGATLLLAALVLLSPRAIRAETKALVRRGDPAALAAVTTAGARLVADRGDYRVYALPDERRSAVASLPGVTLRADFDEVELRRRVIRTADSKVSSRAATTPRALQIVQFAAPPTDADVVSIEATGSRVVHYLPQNAYLVWTGGGAAAKALRTHAAQDPIFQFVGDFTPSDALSPELDAATAAAALVDVTVQIHLPASGSKRDLAAIEAMAEEVILPARTALAGRYVNVRVRVAGVVLMDIASLDTVVNVEPYLEAQPHGERQGQLQAGNQSAGAPTGPGYLGWLAQHGFSLDPTDYPVVVVVDDGVDDGTTSPDTEEFHELGSSANPSRLTFSVLPPGSTGSGPEGPEGHGHINASILGGYSAQVGAVHEDAAGFNYGLGISPFGRMANVRIFSPGFDPGTSQTAMVQDYWTRGARISSNSWGVPAGGVYTAGSQLYDALTRDADGVTSGHQELLFLFSAGNDGPGANTIGAPGTAKNVLTVGAAETSNPAAVAGDGCGTIGSEGDDARDMAPFSSRGPCDDGRIKPEIVSSGTFVMGNASQPVFDGSGVCGATGNDFVAPGTDALFPASSIWTWSSGTSHSTPGVAGYTSLITEFLERTYGETDPSPALVKAYVIHSGRHLTGDGANENLPGSNQGFGFVDMSLGFDALTTRHLIDQTHVFTDPGQSVELVGQVPDATRPVRIALVWTDAPGPTVGSAFVNDLDLEVEMGVDTYRGNHFVLGESQTGGTADTRNNSEAVFLAAGVSGPATLRVLATSIAGDGVPGNADSSDQDFALVAYNFVLATSAGTVALDQAEYSCSTSVTVNVADADLAGLVSQAVVLTSTTGDTETVILAESPPDSGSFVGSIATQTGPVAAEDGTLQVSSGAGVTVLYSDLDDGTGNPAMVMDSAAVDCTGPTVFSVAAGSVVPTAATVSFGTDELASAVVRFGTSCGALTSSVPGPAATSHTIGLSGLTPMTTYFFAVDATDQAGNLTTDDDGGLCHSFVSLGEGDFFTEQFTGDADLQNVQLTFTPNASADFYDHCLKSVTDLPVIPGGTDLGLSDDGSAIVDVTGGEQVSLYGTSYSSFFVNANGNITFSSTDFTFLETITQHFAQPRISANFDDLDPGDGGTVWAQQLSDRVVVTWDGVPAFGSADPNRIQVELFFDGVLRITRLAVTSTAAIVGLSEGLGVPSPFTESDLSAASACPFERVCPPTPAVGCKTAIRSRIVLRDKDADERDSLTWKWLRGQDLLISELGSPGVSTIYAACLYDRTGGTASAPIELQVPASTLWRVLPTQYRYKDKLAAADGVQTLQIVPRIGDKARLTLKAKGVALPLPAPFSGLEYFDADPGVTVQLHHSDGATCLVSDFTKIRVNRPGLFRATGP